MFEKSVPQRTCVCCRLKTDKNKLIRLYFDGKNICAGDKNAFKGRGFYLCGDCALSDIKKIQRALSRALKRAVSEEETRSVISALNKKV